MVSPGMAEAGLKPTISIGSSKASALTVLSTSPDLLVRVMIPSVGPSLGTVMRISEGMPAFTTSMEVMGLTPGISILAIWSRLLPTKRNMPPRMTGLGP